MNIILLSKQDFLINEAKKSKFANEIKFVNEVSKVFDYLETNTVLLYHLDFCENFEENLNQIFEENKNTIIVAFRNNTNNIEGCSLLKKGLKGYAPSFSNFHIIEDIIKAVSSGNIWVYPELMQFLISSIPVESKKEKELLDKLTVKELEVLELVSQGLNNAKIAQTLDLAEVTIKKHISSLFKKLNKKDRLSLALFFKNNL